MSYKAESTVSPAKVTLENLPDGTVHVILTKNSHEETDEEGNVKYTYEEVSFLLPEGREETAETIEGSFERWWNYGSENHTAPTLEERVDVIEEALTALMEM